MNNKLHSITKAIYFLFVLFVLLVCTNSVFLLASGASDTLVMLLFIFILIFLWIWPMPYGRDVRDGRVRQLWYGTMQLHMFLEALVITISYTVTELLLLHRVDDGVSYNIAGGLIIASWSRILSHIIIATVFLSITFWIGIIRIYICSVQLGIRYRVLGILCGWIFLIIIKHII